MNGEILNQALSSYLSENPWLILLLLWIIFWKGLALWQAAQSKQKIWFIALLIVNTMGLLEIIYLLIVRYQKRRVDHNQVN
ncbi:MAG: DUF5652 family protein [Candidatus Paceibacterota bacterium]